jgi:hypothetical protein
MWAQCDLNLAGCGQCNRAHLVCHGFRDLQELAFRDETLATMRKVVARQTLGYVSEPYTLHIGTLDRARQAFFCLYIGGLSHSHDTLVGLSVSPLPMKALSASIDAVSLAFLSNEMNSQAALTLAREQYIVAVRQLAHSLRTPHVLVRDDTLQAVLLLDLYEKMSSPKNWATAAWSSHIMGLTSLIEVRGSDKISSQRASKLALRAINTLCISCAVSGSPISPGISMLRKSLDHVLDEVHQRFTALLADVVNIRTKSAYDVDTIQDAKSIYTRLVAMDAEIQHALAIRRIHTVKKNPQVFGDGYDIYPDFSSVHVWNAVRMIRLEMSRIISSQDNDSSSANAKDVYGVVLATTQEMCAAVPQFILPEVHPGNQVPFTPLQNLHCRMLLTPLYITWQTTADSNMRAWIEHIIAHMRDAGSLKVAKDVLEVMRTNPTMDYWTVYAMTGCYALAA